MRKNKFHYAEALNGLEALNTYKAAAGAFDFVLMGTSLLLGFTLSKLTQSSHRFIHAGNGRYDVES